MDNLENKKFPERLEDVPVKLFKLVSGETIVAYTHEIEEAHGGLIGIEEPMKVIVEDQTHFVMTPWLPFASQKLHVLEDFNVMLTSEVNVDVKAHYMKIILDGTQQNQEEIKEDIRRLRGGSTVH
jgi:hypothetical protein|tara:strand:- start:3090 stop:3464 length:375 start_codon:yes stop_codon:yes gene_type:complete